MQSITKKTTKTTTEEVVYYGDEPANGEGLGMADQVGLLGDDVNADEQCDSSEVDQPAAVADSETSDVTDDDDVTDDGDVTDDLDND